MADVLTPKQRSYCMSQIREKNTKPEIIVRKITHALGYRYRLHRKDLPGNPDLVFPSQKKVIFVHGCFWHRHKCPYGKPMPKSNRKFWKEKLDKNVKRDRCNYIKLGKMGWKKLVIWECQVRNLDALEEKIIKFLG